MHEGRAGDWRGGAMQTVSCSIMTGTIAIAISIGIL